MIDFNTNVLIVDDSQALRLMIKNHVGRMGVKKVFEAGEGNEALNILKQKEEISLVVTD